MVLVRGWEVIILTWESPCVGCRERNARAGVASFSQPLPQVPVLIISSSLAELAKLHAALQEDADIPSSEVRPTQLTICHLQQIVPCCCNLV